MRTEAQKKADQKYNENLKRLTLRFPKKWFEDFENYCLDYGIKSKTAWIRAAIEEKMEREK